MPTLTFTVTPQASGGFSVKPVVNLEGANLGKLNSWNVDIVSMYSQNPVVDEAGEPIQNTGSFQSTQLAGKGGLEVTVGGTTVANWGDLIGVAGDVNYQRDFVSVPPVSRQWFYRSTGEPYTG